MHHGREGMNAGMTQSMAEGACRISCFIFVDRTQRLEAELDSNSQQPTLKTHLCQLDTMSSTDRATGWEQSAQTQES